MFATWQEGVASLILINLPVDLLALAALALACCLLLGAGAMRRISRDSTTFIVSVVLAGAIVAVVGGAIDFATLYTHRYYEGIFNDGWYRSNTTFYSLGFFLVFASIWLSTFLIPRIHVGGCTIIAFFMAILSPTAWWLFGTTISIPIVVAWLALIPLPGVLYLLFRWHSKAIVGTGAAPTTTAPSETG